MVYTTIKLRLFLGLAAVSFVMPVVAQAHLIPTWYEYFCSLGTAAQPVRAQAIANNFMPLATPPMHPLPKVTAAAWLGTKLWSVSCVPFVCATSVIGYAWGKAINRIWNRPAKLVLSDMKKPEHPARLNSLGLEDKAAENNKKAQDAEREHKRWAAIASQAGDSYTADGQLLDPSYRAIAIEPKKKEQEPRVVEVVRDDVVEFEEQIQRDLKHTQDKSAGENSKKEQEDLEAQELAYDDNTRRLTRDIQKFYDKQISIITTLKKSKKQVPSRMYLERLTPEIQAYWTRIKKYLQRIQEVPGADGERALISFYVEKLRNLLQQAQSELGIKN